jgi:hypothetical protein
VAGCRVSGACSDEGHAVVAEEVGGAAQVEAEPGVVLGQLSDLLFEPLHVVDLLPQVRVARLRRKKSNLERMKGQPMKIATGDMGLIEKEKKRKKKRCPSSHQGGVLGGEGGDFAARKGLGFACRFFGAERGCFLDVSELYLFGAG